MAQAVERHLADDRDGRRLEEVGGLEAGEGGADDRPRRLVDDEPRGAAGVLALEAGAGGAVGGDVDRAGVDAGLARLVERLADRGDLGVGEGDAGRADPFGDRLDLAAEQRSRRRPRPGTCPCG